MKEACNLSKPLKVGTWKSRLFWVQLVYYWPFIVINFIFLKKKIKLYNVPVIYESETIEENQVLNLYYILFKLTIFEMNIRNILLNFKRDMKIEKSRTQKYQENILQHQLWFFSVYFVIDVLIIFS